MPREGVEGMLERRTEQHARLVAKDVLGPVAVVDVEIHDGHAGQPVRLHRMGRRDRHVVEQAKSHRHAPFGMVPRRAHGAKNRSRFTSHDEVHRHHTGSRCPFRGAQRAG